MQMAKQNIKPANQRALRLVGRRGVRPGGRDPLRRGHLGRGVRADRGEPQLRHARRRRTTPTSSTTATSRTRRRRPRAPDVNPGAAEIEHDVRGLLRLRRASPPEPTAFDGRSDYKPFQDNGDRRRRPVLRRGGRQVRGAGRASGAAWPAWRSTRTTTRPATTSTTSTSTGYEQNAAERRPRRSSPARAHGPRVACATFQQVDRDGPRRASEKARRRGGRARRLPAANASGDRTARTDPRGGLHGRPSRVRGSRLGGVAAPHLTDLERLAMERVWALGEATVRAVLEGLNAGRARGPAGVHDRC